MEFGGWISMLLSVGFVTALFVTCIIKVLTNSGASEHLHGMDIDTHDTGDGNGD